MKLGIGIGLSSTRAGGAVSIYDPAAEAIFASFTAPPDTARKGRINDYVVAGKAGGWWGKGDVKYAFMAADAQAALRNWINPGTYDGVAVNSPTFTADQGFTGGATKYIDTGFNPATAPSPHFVQNSANIFGWASTNVDVVGAIVGTLGNGTFLIPYGGNILYFVANGSGAVQVSGASTDGLGLFSGCRPDGSTLLVYKNGAVQTTAPAGYASQAVSNENIFVLKRQAAGYWTGLCSSSGILSQLSAAEQLSLYQAELAYQAGVATDKIVAAFSTPPTAGRKTLIYQYVYAMMDAGAWWDGDADYWFAAADAQASLINLTKPGTFNAVAVNSPTFTADQGWTSGATQYLDSGFNPTTAPTPKFTALSACLSAWSLTSGQFAAGGIIGSLDTYVGMIPRFTDDKWYYRVNHTTPYGTVANTDGKGFYSQSRSTASLTEAFKNGTLLGSDATVATVIPTGNIFFNKLSTSIWLGQIASGSIGAHRDATKQLAVYNAKLAYKVGLLGLTYTNIETAKIIDSFTTPPTQARVNLLDAYVTAMKAAGAWTDGDADYWFAAADAQASLINFVNPGTYNAVAVNSPTFTADQGWTGASTKYIDTGFNPTTAPSPKFTQNNAATCAWSLTSAGVAGGIIGVSGLGPAGETFCQPKFSDNFFRASVNDGSGGAVIANAFGNGGAGFWLNSRTGANTFNSYHDGGASFASTAVASQASFNGNILFLNRGGQYYTGQIASGGISAGRDVTKATAVYNAKRAYATGVGIP